MQLKRGRNSFLNNFTLLCHRLGDKVMSNLSIGMRAEDSLTAKGAGDSPDEFLKDFESPKPAVVQMEIDGLSFPRVEHLNDVDGNRGSVVKIDSNNAEYEHIPLKKVGTIRVAYKSAQPLAPRQFVFDDEVE